MRALVIASLALAACSGARHTSGAPSEENGEAVEAASGAETAPSATDCPPTYAAARSLGVDCERAGVACSYPDGACSCEVHYRCSGAPPEPGEPNAWRAWTCREPPPEVREDGCPGREPTDDTACDGRAAVCTYGECAFVPYRCVEGRWQRGTPSAPPSAPGG